MMATYFEGHSHVWNVFATFPISSGSPLQIIFDIPLPSDSSLMIPTDWHQRTTCTGIATQIAASGSRASAWLAAIDLPHTAISEAMAMWQTQRSVSGPVAHMIYITSNCWCPESIGAKARKGTWMINLRWQLRDTCPHSGHECCTSTRFQLI